MRRRSSAAVVIWNIVWREYRRGRTDDGSPQPWKWKSLRIWQLAAASGLPAEED